MDAVSATGAGQAGVDDAGVDVAEEDGADDYDVLGVGFGPSNLALAIAIEEHAERCAPGGRIRARFVEQQAAFGWHTGMLLPGATMQVSYLKDLVTMRDPTSPSSFLSYLHANGRIADFINTGTSTPTRLEFHDYFAWAARRVEHLVDYGTRAVAVLPVRGGDGDGPVRALDVVLRDASGSDGATRTVRTRTLVVATGLQPVLPEGVERGGRVWHTSELLPRLAEADAGADGSGPRRFAVIGAGQSAAEAAGHLHARPGAEVHAVFSRYGYSPADDSAFANRIFDPEAVDDFHRAPPGVREMLLGYHANTNYSAVDGELITELFRRLYAEKVAGDQRLHVHRASRPTKLHVPDDGPRPDWAHAGVELDVEFLPTGEATTLDVDAVVYATGYRPVDPTGLLGEVGAWCRRGTDGELLVERDYRLATADPLDVPIFLQGPTEHTHGISSTLLSNVAVRAGEIRDAVLSARGTWARGRP
ncbi:lysine N(6)-hydroxylase/L-ornithine N(5)-oxygenase family protein [Actinomycetospora sp. TBRC 11914]|uniref:lysine N(6)-hydroxylase/L-ornithine N(5)-oxygenase family protein n=1 Tax=Actinomycetospora sp. TBRC 11914 TaxID=2729387 RepID=UPI00145E7A74|nr:SidA/IucD/PvdA family monooxygenase [Actinomycetospora sp. TBRC 11914]NMO90462.1 lysine N(6)-hydroxylase/L-ornithine N(5)-oxygenase family protein [Actinomycetospora sp. TBRC 11914]